MNRKSTHNKISRNLIISHYKRGIITKQKNMT